MTDLIYTSLYILLVIASVQVLAKAKVTCGPGTQPSERSKGKYHCIICPSGTFSKGRNSTCKRCRTCEGKPRIPCSRETNSVCKTDYEREWKKCSTYLKKNQTGLFASRCANSVLSARRFGCTVSGKCKAVKHDPSRDTTKDGETLAPPPREVWDSDDDVVNLVEDETKPNAVVATKGIHEEFRKFNITIGVIASLIAIFMGATVLLLLLMRHRGKGKRRNIETCLKCKHDTNDMGKVDNAPTYYNNHQSGTCHCYETNLNDVSRKPLPQLDISAPCYMATSLASVHQRDDYMRETYITSPPAVPPARNLSQRTYTAVPRITYESANHYEPVECRYDAGSEEHQNDQQRSETAPLLTEHGIDIDDDGYSTAYTCQKLNEPRKTCPNNLEPEINSTSNDERPLAEAANHSQTNSHSPLLQLEPSTQSQDSCFYDDCEVQGRQEHTCPDDVSEICSNQYYALTDNSTYYISSQYDDTKPVTFRNIQNHHEVKDVNVQAAAAVAVAVAAAGENTYVSNVPLSGTGEPTSEDTIEDDGRVAHLSHQDSQEAAPEGFPRGNSTRYVQSTSFEYLSVQNPPALVRPKDPSEHVCRPENLHENLFKTEGTQTRHNCENLLTIFGQKFDVKDYFTSAGGQLTKSTTDITLTVYPNSLLEGETVLVGGRFTGRSLDVLPYLSEGWVVISPLAEFEMTFRKRWDKHVKIYLPFYSHNPKEEMKVCYYHRDDDGKILTGEVPVLDTTKIQDMYYIRKADHVEIYTVTFTLFHCACDKKFPLFMTSLVFMSYDKDENEAVVRLHVGDKLLGDKTIKEELKAKEGDENCTVLKKSTDLRMLQADNFDGNSCLIFKITPKVRSSSAGAGGESSSWENLYPEEHPQEQKRRFQELVECKGTGHMAAVGTNITSSHSCHTEIEWKYKSTLLEPPDKFQCDLSITHNLADGQAVDRRGACKEGETFISSLKISAYGEKIVKSSSQYGLPELMSTRETSYSKLNH